MEAGVELKKLDRDAAQGKDAAPDQERSTYLVERAGHESHPPTSMMSWPLSS